MDKKAKIWKAVKVVAVIAVVFVVLQYCSDRKEKHRQEAENKAYLLAEAIHEFAEYQYTISDMTYDELYDTLYEITRKSYSLESVANEVLNEFAEQEYDDDRERRNWFY